MKTLQYRIRFKKKKKRYSEAALRKPRYSEGRLFEKQQLKCLWLYFIYKGNQKSYIHLAEAPLLILFSEIY